LDLLTAVDKIEEATKIIKRIGITNIDPDVKFNQKTLIKEKFRNTPQTEALLCVMRESSGCMNINDLAQGLFDIEGLSPPERRRHMKALQSIITRTEEVVPAMNQRGYWKLKDA
jgi:hypothetical protein